MTYPKGTVVIPSLNEGEWLEWTVQSIRENEAADLEIIHVNDCSDKAEPDLSKWDVRQFRLPRRMGAARARAYGIFRTRPDSAAMMTIDGHQKYGAGDAPAAFLEELERFKTVGGLPVDYQPTVKEVALHMEPNKISRLLALVVEHNCLGYISPCRQGTARVMWLNGLIRIGYRGLIKETPYVFTAALNGGNYAGSRDAWERLGGYPQLPGYFGYEEETLTLLAAAHKIPILCATELSPWHVFRSQGIDPIPRPYGTPESRELDNLAAVYRLAFSEKMWQEKWRPLLATAILPGRSHPVPEYCLQSVETPEFTAYRDVIQEDFKLRDDDLLAELQARCLADDQRAQS